MHNVKCTEVRRAGNFGNDLCNRTRSGGGNNIRRFWTWRPPPPPSLQANQNEPPVSRVKKPTSNAYHILSHLAATGPIFLFLLSVQARLENNNNNGEP